MIFKIKKNILSIFVFIFKIAKLLIIFLVLKFIFTKIIQIWKNQLV